jgi:hypothetical protein
VILKIVPKAPNDMHSCQIFPEISQWQRRKARMEILMQLSELSVDFVSVGYTKVKGRPKGLHSVSFNPICSHRSLPSHVQPV